MSNCIIDIDDGCCSIPSMVHTMESSNTVMDEEELSEYMGLQHHRRRVHFAPCPDNRAGIIITSSAGKLLVDCLQWSDDNGVYGLYTGQVERISNGDSTNDSSNIQPHGPGVLIYQDRSAKTCIWTHGLVGASWIPGSHDSKISKSKSAKKHKKKSQRRSKYTPLNLGDTASSAQDMLSDFDPAQIDLLQRHDFAFIQRSDGITWTYAIIADRQVDAIRFVVDDTGSTKTLARKLWSTSIRLVNPKHPPSSKKSKKKKGIPKEPSPSSVSKFVHEPSCFIGGADDLPNLPFAARGCENRERLERRKSCSTVLSLFD